VGFCGLDRRHQPLNGDEVRACWEDGAMPVPPDPSIPGLLDLLTVRALGDPMPTSDPTPAPEAEARRERPTPRLRSISPNRDWVEVEV
jgi:hypothetical protein